MELFGTILVLVVILLLIIFWIFMFLDVIKNNKIKDTEKLLWGIGMLIFPILAIIYFFVASTKQKRLG